MTDQTTTQTVIGRIRRLRKARGITAQQLADGLTAQGYPIQRQILANQETGRVQKVSVDQAQAVADYFDIPVSALFGGSLCQVCADDPPVGFVCRSCGAES